MMDLGGRACWRLRLSGPEGCHDEWRQRGAVVAPAGEQGLRQRINRHRHQSTALMGTFDQRGGVPEQTIRAGELQQHPKHPRIKGHLLGINPLKLNSQWLRPGLQHSPGLWEDGTYYGSLQSKALGDW